MSRKRNRRATSRIGGSIGSELMTSPWLRVPSAHHVWRLTESLMNFTEPSPMPTLTPPGWLLVAVVAPSQPPPEPSEVKLPWPPKKPLSAPVHE